MRSPSMARSAARQNGRSQLAGTQRSHGTQATQSRHRHRRDEDEDGMLKTVSTLNSLITEEVDNGLSASRVVLGGFSQGATMSLLTGLTSERQLGGIVCLSGWVVMREKIRTVSMNSSVSYRLGNHQRN